MPEELKQQFQNMGFIIDPKAVYDGDLVLTDMQLGELPFKYDEKTDILALNSLTKGNKNLYLEFVRKYFINPIGTDISIVRDAFIPIIISELNKEGTRREMHFSYMFSLFKMLPSAHVLEKINGENEEEVVKVYREEMRSVKKAFAEVIQLWQSSEYYHDIKYQLEAQGIPMTKANCQRQHDNYGKLLQIVRGIRISTENKKFNNQEFLNCFDYDKLCLIFGKCVLENTKGIEESAGKVHSSLGEVISYIKSIERAGLKNYNPSIKYYNPNTRRIEKFTYEDLKKKVEEILSRHPEFRTVEIEYAIAEKNNLINNVSNIEQFLKRYIDIQSAEGLMANWEFVPKGEKGPVEEAKSEPRKTTKSEKDPYVELQRKLTTFSGTDYLYKIVGQDKFSGYIGFIYPNGLVVFEKFYEDIENKIPNTKSNATYVMTIDNFAKFSSFDKPKIIAYIRDTKCEDIKRVYHSKTWEERIKKIVSGVDYTPEVEAAIDALISAKKLTNPKEKKV